jgi:hypothetical protein
MSNPPPSMNKQITILLTCFLFAGTAAIADTPTQSPTVSGTVTVTGTSTSGASSTSNGLDPTNVLLYLVIGMMLGAAGQGVRAIVGWKGLQDQVANSQNTTMDDIFRVRDLLISFGIGGVAGILASMGLLASKTNLDDMRSLLGLMAAGYAGTDFIEGFVKQYLPPTKDSLPTPAKGAGTATDDPNANAAVSNGAAAN